MKTRNSALYALGLAAAMTLGSFGSASAQRRANPQQRIPMSKEVPTPHTDTVYVTHVDTVTMRGMTDTVMMTAPMRYDTVVRMVYPPLAKLPNVFFGLGLGADIPMNNLDAVVKSGLAGQAQLGYFPGRSPLGLRVDGTYGKVNDRHTDCRNLCDDPKLWTVGGDVMLRLPIDRTSRLNPVLYVFGGGGYAKFSDVTARQTNFLAGPGGVTFRSESNWYYDFGPGVDFNLGALHLYAEGKYMTLNTDDNLRDQKKVHLFPVFGGIKFGF